MARALPSVAFTLIAACSVLIAWSAWDYGAGYYSTQFSVSLVLIAIVVSAIVLLSEQKKDICASKTLRRIPSVKPPLLVALSVVIWGIAFFQTIALPSEWAVWLIPDSTKLVTDWIPINLGQDSANSIERTASASAGLLGEFPLSISPSYTRVALLGPIAFGAMVWVCFLCFRYQHAIGVFLAIVTGSGAVFAFFGLIDAIRLTRDWQVELRQMLTISPVGADDPFGPFVNNNNASGFLCLATGCAIGCLLLTEHLRSLKGEQSRASRSKFLSGWLVLRVATVALIVVLVAGVIGSNSRGGFLGLLAGAVVLFAFLFPHFSKWKLALLISGIALLSWSVIAWLGFGVRSQERFGTLLDNRIMEDPRLNHWSDAWSAAMYYLPFGSGLGTYRYAYLPFQENGAPLWFVNADGMHVEWLVEGGLWLLPLVGLGLLVLVRHVRRIGCELRRIDSSDTAFSSAAVSTIAYSKCIWAVALFVIPALVVTQCFDFGITLMPLLLTFAGIVGAVLRTSDMIRLVSSGSVLEGDGEREAQVSSTGFATLVARVGDARSVRFSKEVSGPILLVIIVFGLVISANELYVASVAQDEMVWLRRARQQRLLIDLPPLSGRVSRLETLAAANPDNAMVWKALGELRIAEQQRLGAESLFELQPETVDDHASWLAMKTLRHAAYTAEDTDAFSACLLPTQDAEEYRRARKDFIKALILNPLDPNVRIDLLKLDMVTPDANLASRELLLQLADLRSRSDSFLRYLLWLGADYPGTESLSQITELREALQQERLGNGP